MSREDVQHELSGFVDRFRKRLNENVKAIDMNSLFPDLFGEGEFWFFRPATGTEADKILRFVNTGDLFRAQVEAIFHRTYFENGKKRFTQANLEDLKKFDPLDIGILADALGAFDDIAPDVGVAELEKNLDTTHKPKSSSKSPTD